MVGQVEDRAQVALSVGQRGDPRLLGAQQPGQVLRRPDGTVAQQRGGDPHGQREQSAQLDDLRRAGSSGGTCPGPATASEKRERVRARQHVQAQLVRLVQGLSLRRLVTSTRHPADAR